MNDQRSISYNNRSNSSGLPARVVEAIIDQQNAGERLVGWFQLLFLALFGCLYAVAPKAVSTEKTYEKIVIILTVTAVMALAYIGPANCW